MTGVEFQSQVAETLCTFLPRLHTGNKVVAFVLAIVLIRIVKRHPHTFKLVPFIPDITSSDWILDALFFSPEPTAPTPA